MPASDYLVDTNILIYHTSGSQRATDFITKQIANHSFKLSIITKIEFLGWDQHTAEGFEKCRKLLNTATIYPVDDSIADKAIDLKKQKKIKLADAVIAATAILNNMKLVTRNSGDFKAVEGLEVVNIFE